MVKANILRGSKILIVDDTIENINLLRDILSPLGYELFFSPSGEHAVKLLDKVRPDLILLDVMMPGIDGFETCRQMKRMTEHDDIPVIFVTAKTEAVDLAEGFAAGGVDYITKPVNRVELENRVHCHLKIRNFIKSQENFITTLEHGVKERSTGVANMGHELRTPLAAIVGYSDILAEEMLDFDDATHQRWISDVNKISQAGDYLLKLINSVLDMAKLDAGKMAIEEGVFQIDDFLNRIDAIVAPLARKNNNVFEAVAASEITTLQTDETKLQQVIINLLGNACKFTDHGTVRLSIESRGEDVAFVIADSGIGMTGDQLSVLFEEFHQADSSISRRFGGTGLGLAISKRLSHLLGGDISVQSEVDQGTTFTLQIPQLL